jgi:class 3 adenylate cyclase
MATCPNCGNELVDRPRFCPNCGRALGPRVSTQEFRIVTVVFCDVVKSTDLERQLDPQPMQQLLDRYGQAVRRALGGGGASVGKRHGDGFMAAFGVPELHEDDALRAVRAAGELRAALDELAKEVASSAASSSTSGSASTPATCSSATPGPSRRSSPGRP